MKSSKAAVLSALLIPTVFLALTVCGRGRETKEHAQLQSPGIGTLYVSIDDALSTTCFSLPGIDSVVNTTYAGQLDKVVSNLVVPESIQTLCKQLPDKSAGAVKTLQATLIALRQCGVPVLLTPSITEKGEFFLAAHFLSDTSRIGYASCNCSTKLVFTDTSCRDQSVALREIQVGVAAATDSLLPCLMKKVPSGLIAGGWHR